MTKFKIEDIPSQKGRTAIVTGANVGLGYETAKALAAKQMKVVMACRDEDKASEAMSKIRDAVPGAYLEFMHLDLASFDSIRQAADAFRQRHPRLDLLINNAGVMMTPPRTTQDGLELQMGVNYFGHFLLTGLLIDIINATDDSRIVSLSSIAHKTGKIKFDDLQSEQNYSKTGVYSMSKLACLMFAYELQRRLEKLGTNTISVAAHPGVSPTNLARHLNGFYKVLFTVLGPLMAHPPEEGAKPTLYAALGQDIDGGDYTGPAGFREMKGPATKVEGEPQAHDQAAAKRLWAESERIVNFKFLSED